MDNQEKKSIRTYLATNPGRKSITTFVRDGVEHLKGSRGHDTIFLKKPIKDAKCYIEVIGNQPQYYRQFLKYQASFRIGVAPSSYYYDFPLGQLNSIALKKDGNLVTNKTCYEFGPSFDFGDVIGIAINKTKDCDFEELDASYVKFYKNGVLIGSQVEIDKNELCLLAVSLYNEIELELRLSSDSIKYLPKGYQPYMNYLMEK